jgi:hypothetical protein
MLRMNGDASDGTDLHALGLIEMAHALGAFGWVNLIDLLAQVNGLIGAFRLAHITVDAFIGDHQRHAKDSRRVCFKLMVLIIGHAHHPAGGQGCLAKRVFVTRCRRPASKA